MSRSALSLIERGESSPTAIVLDRVAVALGVPLASLFGAPSLTQPSPLSRRSEQVVWRDPASGYVRRAVSPDGVGSPISIVEISFPPKARVAFETGAPDRPPAQQVWLLDGALEVRVGEDRFRLAKGDCLAMRLDRRTIFHNPTDKPARYAVVVTGARR